MSTTAELWTKVTKTAIAIDAKAMRERLRHSLDLTDDRRPGSAGGDETGRRSTARHCTDRHCPDAGVEHSHATYTDPTGDAAMAPSRTAATLEALSHAEAGFIAAVGWLAQRSFSDADIETWDEAIQAADLLDEMDMIADTTRIYPEARKQIHHAKDALATIVAMVRDNAPHPPNQWQRMADENGRPTCRAHATIGVRDRACTSKLLCEWCWDQLHYLDGDPVAMQYEPTNWPSSDMLRAHTASDRIHIKRYRHEWITAHSGRREAS